MDNKIIEKIQKLLSLAESPNKNEAESAMAKAQQLMTKHNIEMQTVENHDSEYINMTTETYGRASIQDKYINDILVKFFFVRLVQSRRNSGLFLNIVGEKNNVKTAIHMRQYLKNVFNTLWQEYRKETGAKANAKQSFFFGIWKGFSEKMQEERYNAQQQYDVVLVNDPKVDEKVDELFGKLRSAGKSRVNAGDAQARAAGHAQGRKLNVNSGALTA